MSREVPTREDIEEALASLEVNDALWRMARCNGTMPVYLAAKAWVEYIDRGIAAAEDKS